MTTNTSNFHKRLLTRLRVCWIASLCLCLPAMLPELNAKPGGKGGGGKPGNSGNSGNSDSSGSSGSSDSSGGSSGSSSSSGNSGNSGNSGSGGTIGDATGATTARYHLSDWRLGGNYQIVGPTRMYIEGDLNIGNNTITITQSGSLELFIGGSINVNGRGSINNTGVPSQLIILGTHPPKQSTDSPDHSLTLSGNGALTGVVYAPNAEYRTNGGGNAGQTSGSVVALDIRFNGSPGPFHFDEALQDLDLGIGNYSLSAYELMPNGAPIGSDNGEAVFGTKDYEKLFDTLF